MPKFWSETWNQKLQDIFCDIIFFCIYVTLRTALLAPHIGTMQQFYYAI